MLLSAPVRSVADGHVKMGRMPVAAPACAPAWGGRHGRACVVGRGPGELGSGLASRGRTPRHRRGPLEALVGPPGAGGPARAVLPRHPMYISGKTGFSKV